jgi:glucosylceramidase
MKKAIFFLAIIQSAIAIGQNPKMIQVTTTRNQPWFSNNHEVSLVETENSDVELLANNKLQIIEGFGACFNELGWTSLSILSESDRNYILRELFEPNYGLNLNICRMPIGANDFSRNWYSYSEIENDFKMDSFSIKNDLETLIPFIKNAQIYNPSLKIWSSPWSPPEWMKYNKHYACFSSDKNVNEKFRNYLKPEMQGKEGKNLFIQNKKYFKAYALYFSKFIDAYQKQGINVSTIMPQNEFNSCQIFPSCTWTSKGLAEFIGKYLGPEMRKKNVELMFGTMERSNVALVDTILTDKYAKKYVSGIGFQWEGKEAISKIYQKYPNMKLYQTEQECGDGKNDWEYCNYTWDLIKKYLKNGASAYMYWNISLEKGGFSRWGWQQNSLITVDSQKKTFHFNHEYYLMKHLSHFVKKGAQRLETKGKFDNLLAFINPDKSIVVVTQNNSNDSKQLSLKKGQNTFKIILAPNSFSTFFIE